MCEWLSCGDWCDVQLLCGGRSFSAHRAVLASVSTFLRHLLLSSSDDTTFIVLPDFDIEAMASVLYYIYNGEVVLQKKKLGLFLDIIQAMQIYVDCQYLTKIQGVEDQDCFLDKHSATAFPGEIFTLGINNDGDQHIFNIKKLKESGKALLKYSRSNLDFDDNVVRCQNESELSESRLGNLKSQCEGRQRNSLLRDLYIETYPPNGNVNGLTESVLAISNECYQSPASVLLANANCRHLSVDSLTRQSREVAGHSLPSTLESGFNSTEKCNDTSENIDYKQRNTSPTSKKQTHINRLISKDRNEINYEEQLHFDVTKLVSNLLDYRDSKSMEHLVMDNAKYHSVRKNSQIKTKKSTKVIYNHVLESPWNARKPNNYRPFRRKEKYVETVPAELEENKDLENDTNNNFQKVTLLPKEIPLERVIIKENEHIDSPMVVENKEGFKCAQCDQVFTSGESLSVHMRRHLSNARYTCGECGKTFSQLRNFKYHMSIHRGTREFAATCTVCGKYFNDRGYLSSHMKIHRNRKEYKCTLCPKSFNQRVAYNMHVRIHTEQNTIMNMDLLLNRNRESCKNCEAVSTPTSSIGVKPHVCDECGKAFSRKMLLKQHQRTHSGERPYACPHCDKRFADRSNMTLHLRLHTGVKPFSCSLCPKSFTKKHHLKSHLNFHTGSKPYSCPRCGLAFTQSSNMRTHYKKCTAPEPSTSNTCLVLP